MLFEIKGDFASPPNHHLSSHPLVLPWPPRAGKEGGRWGMGGMVERMGCCHSLRRSHQDGFLQSSFSSLFLLFVLPSLASASCWHVSSPTVQFLCFFCLFPITNTCSTCRAYRSALHSPPGLY